MTQLFDNYIEDIEKSFSFIKSTLSQFKQSPLSKKQSSLPSVKIELYEIEKLIKLMETEIVSFTGNQKNSKAQKIKTYKVDFDSLRKKVNIAEQEIQKQRQDQQKVSNKTPSSGNSLELHEHKSTRSRSKYSRLQQSTPKSDQQDTTNFKLKESVKVMYQIGDMSDNISYQLAGQTDKMEQGISKMGRIRGELIKGEKKIKKIMVRLRRNQLVFYVVILMVTLMIAFLIVKVFT